MYTALYRSHRPEVFDQILGQEHIVKILKNQVAAGTVSHAYLFCGTRGTGKTTTARILAKAVNCLAGGDRPCGTCEHCRAIKDGTFMDVIEIDAASNNGVENIRELRESVKYPPAAGRKKVYIIDEVHMLSTGAFNALLKTLEEPPEHVMFILATTEPQKLPSTILSRCMRLDFKRVPQKVIAEDMAAICREKGVELTEDAARLLANCADGSVRDGLSILDQVMAGGDRYIDRDKVLEYVGTTGEEFFIDLTELVAMHKSAEALILLNDVLEEGKDVRQIMKDWVSHYRSLLITKFVKDAEDMLNMSSENLRRVEEQSRRITVEEIDSAVTRLSSTINDARWSTNPRVLMELAIVAISSSGSNIQTAAKVAHTVSQQEERKSENQVSSRVDEKYKETLQPDRTSDKSLRQNDSGHIEEPKQDSQITRSYQMPQKAADVKKEQEETSLKEPGKQDTDVIHNSNITKCAEVSSPQTGNTADELSLTALWHSIFEEGEDMAGSFNLIRSGTKLHHVGKDNFTVVANSGFTGRYVEQKRQEIEKLMEKHTGRHLKLICRLQGELESAEPSEDKETERIAKEAEKLLGIDIEIE